MAGHVVGTFVGMGEIRVFIRNETIEIALQVPPGGWVRILHKDQAAASVATKDDAHSIGYPRMG